ncbi:hypothetical protein M409DRAFT_23140 [Zasmidium cellare ATCC 36951]|uniref:Myb-like domain-containing protein n=1 Tax=Zasmidium cellare ATCC 36951 TaxID=1080233 RepID=A0A6A6CKP3_ZASCE|nr:uncharacterized protein M409DRAFT_23140 [Zasmidium cellare ATCC 36951]KAF2166502.1 hypothetical protein M409DRAFT_23140 [Zasmidium cellare ATCC 36951]
MAIWKTRLTLIYHGGVLRTSPNIYNLPGPQTRPFTHYPHLHEGQKWTPTELQTLQTLSTTGTTNRTIREHHLPHRTLEAIALQRHRLGLKTRSKPPPWTAAETATLQTALERGLTWTEIRLRELPQRTESAMKGKVRRMEVYGACGGRKERRKWGVGEVERLRWLREVEGLCWGDVAVEMGRSEVAVAGKYWFSRRGERRGRGGVEKDGG